MSITARMMEFISAERNQFLVYFALSLSVVVCTALLHGRNSTIYQPFVGERSPVIAVVLISILGFVLLTILLARGWFSIVQAQFLQGLAVAGGLAVLFSLVMIIADTVIVLPADINRPFPDSLLFYPSIGFAVEILFHVLPLTLLLVVVTSLSESLTFDRVIWPAILFVALLEPIYQTAFGFSGSYPIWVFGFIALHIFLLNLCQLVLFKHYDFVSMYFFRLAYYLLWHIVWGVIRLKLLF